jgi:hypothetical protein
VIKTKREKKSLNLNPRIREKKGRKTTETDGNKLNSYELYKCKRERKSLNLVMVKNMKLIISLCVFVCDFLCIFVCGLKA